MAGKESGKKQEKENDSNFMHRVRIAGVIVDGKLPIDKAVMNIKGIGDRVSQSITPKLDFAEGKRVGDLNEKEIKKLENIHEHVPNWMVNRKKNPENGKYEHFIGPNLDMSLREDLNRLKKIKSYRGIRHSLHLPVRGQRTKSTFRHGTTLGVSRRKAK